MTWRHDAVEDLVEWQHRQCAICRRKFTPSRLAYLDHEHKTGEIRGALCNRCNGLLGVVGEDVQLLLRMVRYLLDPPSRECWVEPQWWPGSTGAAGLEA